MSKTFSSLLVVSLLVFGLLITAETATAQQELRPLVAAPQPFDKASINGSWKPVRGILAGRELPTEQLESIQLTINNGAYETQGTGFAESGKMVFPGPVADKPQAIDVVIEKGGNAGTTMQGIVRVENENLIVCYAISGERPGSFVSGEGGQSLLLEYEKVYGFRSAATPRINQEEEEQLHVNDGKK